MVGAVLRPGAAVHHQLGPHERADRGLVLERAGDPHHHHPVDSDRIEEPLDALAASSVPIPVTIATTS